MMLAPPKISGRNPLLQFRSGKMTYAAGMVTPDKSKGFLSVVQSSSGMIEFIWSGPGSSDLDPPILVTGGDATFNRVDKCTTGRVFVLRLAGGSSNPQHCRFFWMQEIATDRDEEIMKKIKKLIGDNGPTPKAPESSSAAPQGGAAAAGSSAPVTGAPKGPISAEAFRQMLANVSQGAAKGTSRAAMGMQPRAPADDVNLQALLGSDMVLTAIREDPMYYMQSDVVSEIRNPQASAAAATLHAALSEAPKEVTTAFGVGSADGEVGSTVFVNRIIADAEKSAAEASGESKGKDNTTNDEDDG